MAAMSTCISFAPLATAAAARRSTAARRSSMLSARKVAPPSMIVVRAGNDDGDFMGEIGLGEDMEDMLKKADGGKSVPKFIADLGVDELTAAFKFLGSDEMTGPGSQALFVEKYGETLYRQAGFTPMAELINGRLAQVGFVLALQHTFDGDVLTLIAKWPLFVLFIVAAITSASLVPTAAPKGYFPDGLKSGVMEAYEGAGLNDVFSVKAETINGRAAMVGMAVFLATACVF